MKPLTIALDARLAGGSSTGDSSYWTGLLFGLGQCGGDFRLLLFGTQRTQVDAADPDRSRWVRTQARNARWWSLVTFPLAARKLGADAIHTQYNLSPLAGKHGVTTIHDVSFFVGPEWFKAKDRILLQRTVPASVRRASRVLAVSETTKREIEQTMPFASGKVSVTPNALSPSFSPVDRQRAKAIVGEELGIEGAYVLTVGTRWPRKNMALAVEAMRMLDEGMPHQLVLTGHPGWGEIGASDRVRIVGYVPERQLWALYAAADLYLVPSRHEGFGIPLLEAWASGCPVLCSQGGALPEIAGNAAYVEPSWDPKDWAASIETLLRDPNRRDGLRALGFERLKCFDWTKTAELTLEAYREAAK